MLKVYTKYLSILCMVVTFNIFGASEEAARLLETDGTRGSAAPVASMEIVNNFSHNIDAFRKLGLIGATGDIRTDMQAFPYLMRLMQGGSPERSDAEILAMDMSEPGESKAIRMCGEGEEKLWNGDYVGALRLLLIAEMHGDPIAGERLQEIFENPSKYKSPRACKVHMISTSKEVTSLRDLLDPCTLLAEAYKVRASGFPGLRIRQHLVDYQHRLIAANAKAIEDRDSTGGAAGGSGVPTSAEVEVGAAAGAGSSTSARGSLGGDATITMPGDSSSGDEEERRLGQDNATEASAAAAPVAYGGTIEVLRHRLPAKPA